MSAKQAIGHAGIELFGDSRSAARGGYCLQDADMNCVVDICHRMDGIPLAIEITAMRAARIGFRFLASGRLFLHARNDPVLCPRSA